jgi:hypothetical protein
MAVKNTTKIVLLNVYYFGLKLLEKDGASVEILHEGRIENLQYHDHNERARIVVERIPAGRIFLAGTYDLMKIWGKGD